MEVGIGAKGTQVLTFRRFTFKFPLSAYARYSITNLAQRLVVKLLIFGLLFIRGKARGQGGRPPPMTKSGARERLKSAIKSMHWKAALKKQMQLLFSNWKRAYLFIHKGVSIIFKGCSR